MRQPNVDDLVKSIAADTHTPPEVVERVYEQTWAEYSDGARIVDYLTVLVAKRVREKLRGAARTRN